MRFKRIAFLLLVAVAVVVGSAAPAAAAVLAEGPAADAAGSAPTVFVAADKNGNNSSETFIRNPYLAINRWFLSSMSFHDKFSPSIMSEFAEKVSRNTNQITSMTAGNTIWYVNGEISRTAIEFNIMDVAGESVDKAVGQMGTQLFPTATTTPNLTLVGILATGLVITVGTMYYRSRARGGAAVLKRVLSLAVVVAVLTIMAAGASQSTTSNGKYVPGPGSPGWVVSKVNDAVSFGGNEAAQGFISVQDQVVNAQDTPGGAGESFSCDAFESGLDNRLQEYDAANVSATSSSGITKVINSLWRATGIEAWKTAQYGSDNPYGAYMWCRGLEVNSPTITAEETQNISKRGNHQVIDNETALAGTSGKAGPVFTARNKDEEDRFLIAWAACRVSSDGTSFTVAEGWGAARPDNGRPLVTGDDCRNWWTGGSGEFPDKSWWTGGAGQFPDAFDIGDTASGDLEKKSSDPRVLNFVKALHGTDTSVGNVASITYVISAVLMMLVFGAIGLLVIGAKIFLIGFVLALFAVTLLALFNRNGATEKIVQMAQHLLGVTVFSAGAVLLFGLIAMFTKIMVTFGQTLWGAGTPMGLLWSGLAPVIAVVMIHYLFVKLFKLPSPMTPKGAFAWGAAGGATGSAVMSSIAKRAKSRAVDAARSVGSDMVSRATGGRIGNRIGNRGGMDGGVRNAANASAKEGQKDLQAAAAKVNMSTRERKAEAKTDLAAARGLDRANNPGTASALGAGERVALAASNTVGAVRGAGTLARNAGGRVLSGAKTIYGGAQQALAYASSDKETRTRMMGEARTRAAAGATTFLTQAKAARSDAWAKQRERYGLTTQQRERIDATRERNLDRVALATSNVPARDGQTPVAKWSIVATASRTRALASNASATLGAHATAVGGGLGRDIKNTAASAAAAAPALRRDIKAAVTSRPVRYTAVAVAAATMPFGQVAAASYVAHRIDKAVGTRKTERAQMIQRYRAHQAQEQAAVAKREQVQQRARDKADQKAMNRVAEAAAGVSSNSEPPRSPAPVSTSTPTTIKGVRQ
ncbi:tripartite tricarboxylate transporter TctB family protein [Rathayibacter iranicus]|uniref:Uncharacterized protein n=2 Tax=Rathayibacter iranicus TaxID=59737 RepID=A0AAD1AB65_9MICO|nr:tripartite tricarboxylate transporter TctB family protein [Rathayibacter iranicus]AZZ54996.1 hypothetical protein C7V51_03165 [Rathayibacter iranicus]MWV32278.1 hypothetical protein [Rathayibacter iranicus NCPPB 2253 = VKM Ac-1602]PPI62380.1 hypothetical protein C5E08_03170 [Rathayibacter iranicus]PWJ61104.1 hypothetical protein B0H03_12042 [Rathayibacter iranicus NCPPB 2253 = VKM Ac-1602]